MRTKVKMPGYVAALLREDYSIVYRTAYSAAAARTWRDHNAFGCRATVVGKLPEGDLTAHLRTFFFAPEVAVTDLGEIPE